MVPNDAKSTYKGVQKYNHSYQTVVKANPSQGWRDPEGSRRLRLPDSTTIGT